MSQPLLQLHFARSVDLPEVKNEAGATTRAATNIRLHGMSGRCVRIRTPLSETLHSKCESDAGKMAGKDASLRDIRNLMVRFCLYEMVREISSSVDSLEQVKPDQWIKVVANDFITVPEKAWGNFFTVQDTQLLEQEYSKWHDLPMAAVEILSGKAFPVASEG